MPDPDALTDLLARYRTAIARDMAEGGRSPETRRRVEDAAYILCVATGTCAIDDALIAVRRRLEVCRADNGHLTV